MIDVLIIDGKENRRNGLSALIDGTPGYCCVASYSKMDNLINLVEIHLPDIVLINNFELKNIDINSLKQSKQVLIDLNIIVLSNEDDTDLILNLLKAGVYGLLSNQITPAKLLDAIHDVAGNGAQIDSHISRKILDFLLTSEQSSKTNLQILTKRELEVLTGLSDGKNYREIAQQLFISLSTVRFHLQNVYNKLNVHSEAEAVAKALRQGYI